MILGAGILVRVVVFLQNRSLFLDEVNLARNIADRSITGLFSPLDHQQYAPPLFLLLEKLNWLLVGSSELVLRFWPLIMGIAALYLLYRLLIDQLGKTLPAVMLLWLFAFSQVYIRYATELKQYSTDMAVSTMLIYLAIRYPLNRHWFPWMGIGSVAVWLSMPSVFILAGIGCYWLVSYLKDRSGTPFTRIVVTTGIWLLSFSFYYWLILRHDVGRPGLLAYHQQYFWPLLPTTNEEWQRLGILITDLLGTLSGHTVPALAFGGIGLSAGLISLWRSNRSMLLLLLLPVVLCLLASGLGKYSLIQRLSLFMMPALGLLLGLGWQYLWQRPRHWGKWMAVLLFLTVLPLRKGVEYFFRPLPGEDMRSLLLQLNEQIQHGDHLWIDHNARPAFTWYTSYAPLPVDRVRQADRIFSTWNGTAEEELAGNITISGSTWLLFSHLVSETNRQEMQQDLEGARKVFGAPDEVLQFSGVAAIRFK